MKDDKKCQHEKVNLELSWLPTKSISSQVLGVNKISRVSQKVPDRNQKEKQVGKVGKVGKVRKGFHCGAKPLPHLLLAATTWNYLKVPAAASLYLYVKVAEDSQQLAILDEISQ